MIMASILDDSEKLDPRDSHHLIELGKNPVRIGFMHVVMKWMELISPLNHWSWIFVASA